MTRTITSRQSHKLHGPQLKILSCNLMLEFSAVYGLSIDPKHILVSLFLVIEFKDIALPNLKLAYVKRQYILKNKTQIHNSGLWTSFV